MKRSVGLWQFALFALTSILGTVLHYLYDLSDGAVWIAPFSGVNESTWEHMKLLFWPMFALAVFQSFFFGDYEDFWCVKLRGTLLGICLIPIIFYTYNGVIGKSPAWINIAIFFLSAAISYFYEATLMKKESECRISKRLAISILTFFALLFVIFTFYTPKIEVFKDPITNTFGISG